jgi:glucose/arabinose dehydrogenase
MIFSPKSGGTRVAAGPVAVAVLAALGFSQTGSFHGAPDSAKQQKNPVAGQPAAIEAGKKLYGRNCLACHGKAGQGSGNVPPLAKGKLNAVSDGEVFWFITKGDKENGMPSWAFLPEDQRWQIVSYVKSGELGIGATQAAEADTGKGKIGAPPPTAPFTDFRYEEPGKTRKITAADLPEPYATKSANNGARLVSRPSDVWPKAPVGFKVELYATGLNNPRLLRTAPNGDIFLAEMEAGRIRVFRGINADGTAKEMHTFASGLKQPYGIAFYPPGPNPEWVYVGNTASVVKFAYHNGDVEAKGDPQKVADLPDTGGHSTRSVVFSPDGKVMYVSVGSRSNVDDPDTTEAEKNRADILTFNPDGSNMHVFASGIRNAGGGLAINPQNGELWCSVNERDALGDNLVPDYITHVQEGGFYGWPWWYIGAHQDPRHKGKHPELAEKAIVPDVLLQAHNASLNLAFYQGKSFPKEYEGDIFASEHGSWNKGVRVGYEVIRVPMHHSNRASGDYEDFLTGFVLPDGNVWGRPVGVTVAPDGSLLVSDDGSNSIWRVSYAGKQSASTNGH